MVLIDFWTYTCINCIRTLPYVESWDADYRKDGLTVIGVHSPEFAFEKDAGNVADAIDRYGINYPVVQDNDLGTWNAFGNQYWPAKYLIDADGHIRYAHFGEGSYGQTEAAIRSLLAEAGAGRLGAAAKPGRTVERADPMLRTPETYLGTARAQGWIAGPQPGSKDYGALDPGSLRRTSSPTAAPGISATRRRPRVRALGIALRFQARRVFLVLGSEDRPRSLQVLLDGKPIAAADAGEDVHGGEATISGPAPVPARRPAARG